MFTDRMDAGVSLSQQLLHLKDKNPAVFALARGGVPVGFEIAVALGAPLDAVLVRKLGAPGHEELAIGAIADGPQPEVILNRAIIDQLAVSSRYIDRIVERESAEIARRKALYFRDRARIDPKGKTAIVVDDGIATGATVQAALASIRRQQPARLVLAVPVASQDTIEQLRREVDELVCLYHPIWMQAVGLFYEDFSQVSDAEVVDLLERATQPKPAKASASADAESR
jgi:putative phosphoribosyl transferase